MYNYIAEQYLSSMAGVPLTETIVFLELDMRHRVSCGYTGST